MYMQTIQTYTVTFNIDNDEYITSLYVSQDELLSFIKVLTFNGIYDFSVKPGDGAFNLPLQNEIPTWLSGVNYDSDIEDDVSDSNIESDGNWDQEQDFIKLKEKIDKTLKFLGIDERDIYDTIDP